jgi:Fe-S protein assembly co-chaperone HscB
MTLPLFFQALEIDLNKFNLNSEELEKKYHAMSRRWHPDLNSNSEESIAHTSLINSAYKVLRDPWTRAQYLLDLFEVKLSQQLPPALAEIYFELQEAEDVKGLAELEVQLQETQAQLGLSLQKFWERLERSGFSLSNGNAENWTSELEELRKLVEEHKYVVAMGRDLRARRSE